MKKRIIAVGAAGIVALTVAGCSSENLIARAEQASVIAEKSDIAASEITAFLGKYGPEDIEDSQVADFVRGVLPDEWDARFDDAVERIGSAREAASSIAYHLDGLADDLRGEANDLLDQAERNESNWANAQVLGLSIFEILTGGSVTGIIASIAGVFRSNKKRKAAEQETEEIVTAIEAAREIDDDLDDAFSGEAGRLVNRAMSNSTATRVRDIRAKVRRPIA